MGKVTFILCIITIMSISFSACTSNKDTVGVSIKGAWDILLANGVSTAGGDHQAYISFEANGEMNGNASVNSFFGSYKYSGNKLFLMNVGMTRMMGANMKIEDAVIQALNSVSTIKINGNSASVYNSRGNEIMILKKK